MTPDSQAAGRPAKVVRRSLPRMLAVIIGFVMTAAGLGMTATIVMLPAGIVIGLVGVGIIVGGLFAPDFRREPPGNQM